jgi:glycyl-tRNA synthetase
MNQEVWGGVTLEDKTITLRDRDTTQQIRINASEVKEILRRVIRGENLLKFGKKTQTRTK